MTKLNTAFGLAFIIMSRAWSQRFVRMITVPLGVIEEKQLSNLHRHSVSKTMWKFHGVYRRIGGRYAIHAGR